APTADPRALRVRQCGGDHGARCRLPGRALARVIDDVQLPRGPTYAGVVMTKLVARSGLSTVVPANAGTHTHCGSELAVSSNNGKSGEYRSPPSRGRQRRGLQTWLGSALAAALLFSLPSPAAAQSPVESFYRDKRVRMLVGYGVGTGNDLYLRLLARRVGKY